MCVTMLVGTTLAWFTDSASTSVNKIEAGRLKVDIVDADNTDTTLKGGENTKTITIISNGNKVIFNKLNSNLSQINCNGAKLVIKNATVAVGTDDATRSTWDAHDIVFKGDVAFENVTFERAVAINGNASFKNCTISERTPTRRLICSGSRQAPMSRWITAPLMARATPRMATAPLPLRMSMLPMPAFPRTRRGDPFGRPLRRGTARRRQLRK